ncbi:GDSL-type esterase/lipase family protein [Herbidospora daliensis]|uniref:GDSL-type esterase/lipase family protein n=1 Tax=Herbidospora daliensis TaxID=295585 RepID=UPI000785287B|nr:GDSL-type esterase/lipase family protein [Herbidospora daliensis]
MIKKITPVAAALALLLWPGTVQASTQPMTIAALGDSITAGFNACGWYVACTSRSWAVGDHKDVNSHYLRLLADGVDVKGRNRNFAYNGATSDDLMEQMDEAIKAKATYVTILIGAQDACVRTESQMTPVATYRARVDAALAKLAPTGAQVRILSIPDLKRLWRVAKDNPVARAFWGIARICQTMLANPTSTARKDEDRRDRVRARVMAYNTEMARACAAYGPLCRHDGGEVFRYQFPVSMVSKWDFFHPNAEGQKTIARLSFQRVESPV